MQWDSRMSSLLRLTWGLTVRDERAEDGVPQEVFSKDNITKEYRQLEGGLYQLGNEFPEHSYVDLIEITMIGFTYGIGFERQGIIVLNLKRFVSEARKLITLVVRSQPLPISPVLVIEMIQG
jgi:hypothetical protein